jgi:hypothetical protein
MPLYAEDLRNQHTSRVGTPLSMSSRQFASSAIRVEGTSSMELDSGGNGDH